MNVKSYYVETGPLQNCQLDRDVRFPTRREAEQAVCTLRGMRDCRDFTPEVIESDLPATTTYPVWVRADW